MFHHSVARTGADRSTADTPPRHTLTRFVGVGGVATVVQLGLLAGLTVVIDETWANLIAWTVSTLLANAVHRRVTFGVHDRTGARRDMLVATAFSVVALLLSTAVLNHLDISNAMSAVLVLVAVNTIVGGVRYAALHWWFVTRPTHHVAVEFGHVASAV